MTSILPGLADCSHPSVVYYIGRGSRIKIGTTTRLSQRMAELEADVLLALEPGGRDHETLRHAQFDQWRLTGEWFEAADPLLDLIDCLVVANGLPDLPEQAGAIRPSTPQIPEASIVGYYRSYATGQLYAQVRTGRWAGRTGLARETRLIPIPSQGLGQPQSQAAARASI